MHGKILAVDDEPDQLELLDELLTEEGFTIETAANGLEALDMVGRCRPNMIIVDVSMPKMDGFTFCEKLRKTPKNARPRRHSRAHADRVARALRPVERLCTWCQRLSHPAVQTE